MMAKVNTLEILRNKKGRWFLKSNHQFLVIPSPHEMKDRDFLEIPDGNRIHVIQIQKGVWKHIRTDH